MHSRGATSPQRCYEVALYASELEPGDGSHAAQWCYLWYNLLLT